MYIYRIIFPLYIDAGFERKTYCREKNRLVHEIVGHNSKTLNETSTYYQKLKEFHEALLSERFRGEVTFPKRNMGRRERKVVS